jgi:ribosomal protein S18 acetylase RimI-like enzyme
VIRSARRAELKEVLELWAVSPSASAAAGDELAGLRRLLDHSPDALVVAELEGRLVGTLIAAWDGWRGNMYRLAVHPAHRRRRVALELVRVGEDRLRAAGARRVTALVAAEDDPAVALWGTAGYAHDERTGRFVRNL